MSAAGLCLRLLVVTAAVTATAASVRFQVCGAHLVDTLRVVCGGVYNKAFSKKSLEGMQMDDAAVFWPPTREEEQQQQEEGDRPDYAHPQALFRGRASGRRRRGVVDECCFRSCSLHELRQYCG
ncbi:LIRP-like [Bacillus rossius redtenbacheri]